MTEIQMYGVKELQEILGVSKNTAYDLMRQPNFPSIRIGRKYLVEYEALRRWIEKQQRYIS